MSPVSRRRKGATARVVRAVPAYVEPEPCNCPACTGEEFDPAEMFDDLLGGMGELAEVDDPTEAELLAALFFAAAPITADEVVPSLITAATPQAFALLLELDAVRGSPATAAAVEQLAQAGMPEPRWAAATREPLTGHLFRAFRFEEVAASMLVCSFERAGRTQAFVVKIDDTDCHSAIDIQLAPGEVLDEFMAQTPVEAEKEGIQVVAEDLAPEDFRWEIERALDARAVHDEEDGPMPEEPDDSDKPDYDVLAELLRSRMRTLPEPTRPPARHGSDDFSLVESIGHIAEAAEESGNNRLKRLGQAKLPPKPKRKKADGPAPIYQIKVSLRGAKPPIWRRLELPADTTLARLHRIIQVAFGWDDSHLHIFRTPYGEFGDEGRSEASVTLEQMAGEMFTYLYDFGDNWLHEIVFEDTPTREQVTYPRCTDGRRAAPSEDSGGVWGYEELVAVLADPSHPEHQDRLEWLGLDSADDFQPARFDQAAINEALARLR
ncbi:plasmid pRiA4b ORF-3 family protein [Actinoplanes sp. NPDC051411]|uniref:plasmid pRiA4b ORF-3 family protein n=1 Tax=Actinoplanes sp. NPDC051411 TaxID=3155522 RepID=UPI0034270178